MNKCTWPLGNGQTVEFNIYDPQITTWKAVAGLYIFAYDDGQYWQALYIGQTDDFSARLPHHERLDEAAQRGATHIHAVVVPPAANRDTLEIRGLFSCRHPPQLIFQPTFPVFIHVGF